jgi:hypothetical protein
MKTNNILENVIKSVLLESVIDAVPRTATDKEYAIGKAAGMKAVFAVLVVGKPNNVRDLLANIRNAIESSAETRKYADGLNQKPCAYILLNDVNLTARRQRIIIGVKALETPFKTSFANDPQTPGDDYTLYTGLLLIGNEDAPLMTNTLYKELLQKQSLPGHGSQKQHELIGDYDYNERATDANVVTPNNQQTPAENVIGKYPYEWKRDNGKLTFIVYTLSETPDWVYIPIENNTKIYKAKKLDFEQHYNDNGIMKYFTEVTDPIEIQNIKTKLKL